MRLTTSIVGIALLSSAAHAQVFSGGGFDIEPDEFEQINNDISGLVGEFDSFILRVDFGGDTPNPNEFDIDIRANMRTNDNVPFTLFLDDNNFSFDYDENNILIIEDPFMNTLNGTDYNNLRLTLFNDDNSDLDIVSWELTLVPAPSTVGMLAFAGVLAARRRRA